MDLLLKNLTWIQESTRYSGDIRIRRGKILDIGLLNAGKKERVIEFDNHYLYPGLINSHDHLEMNLYGRMGTPLYNNYTEWARDIYKPRESPVREIESVDLKLRLWWGGVKNLISGVTTVIHHNPWHRTLGRSDYPVKVLKNYRWAHSLAFEKKTKIVRQFPSKTSTPFIIHIAEGIDEVAKGEVQKLDSLHALRSNTILVHAVGLTVDDIARIKDTRASIIWCPSSNLFMFGQTADIGNLKKDTRIGLGTDSTMTGLPSLFDEMRAAVGSGLATASEVVDMVTRIPNQIFRLPGQQIMKGANADFLIVRKLRDDYFENLVASQTQDITAVFVNGQFRFGDPAFMNELKLELWLWKFGRAEKAIACDISNLVHKIQKQVDAVHLNGNPLWRLIAG